MTAIGGRRRERLPAQRDQVVLVHKPLNPLGINQQAGTPEEGGDPPVAVEAMRQAERLDQARQLHISRARCQLFVPAIVGRPREASELAQMPNVSFAVR